MFEHIAFWRPNDNAAKDWHLCHYSIDGVVELSPQSDERFRAKVDRTDEMIAELGKNGWQLVSTVPQAKGLELWFKRHVDKQQQLNALLLPLFMASSEAAAKVKSAPVSKIEPTWQLPADIE